MLENNRFSFIYSKDQIFDESVANKLRPEVKSKLGYPISNMFPRFAKTFPNTTSLIEKLWDKPVVAFRLVDNIWLPRLVCESKTTNIFFNLKYLHHPEDGPEFENDFDMLPPEWRENYRSFESFCITEDSVLPIAWFNTPLSYGARLSAEEYCKEFGVKKKKCKELRKKGTQFFIPMLDADRGR